MSETDTPGRRQTAAGAAARPLRSLLFVPGIKPEWMRRALGCGADALILDLEDSVPDTRKAQAREQVASFLASQPHGPELLVRINDMSTPQALADLQAVVTPGLHGVLVPKVTSAVDIQVLDRLLSWLEATAGMPVGATLVCPGLETAYSMCFPYEIASASPRVAYMGGLSVKGGDIEGAVGYRWSREGSETLTYRSQILLAARAAGVPHPVTGLWSDVEDLDGLRSFARQGRDLGYEGLLAIHPRHVPVINEVFTPSEEELLHYRKLVQSMEAAQASGLSSTTHGGHMVDTAMAKRAQAWLAGHEHEHADRNGTQ